ncbi:hypothetical protein [Natrialba asiatica]|uniref:Uncharacterized protein n=1 Tax=Natrialba asiatica (strain ATCC 700177 / DSM 12278 / JCM 9576 / FERM P-10747 / NBRC 102637 / 172P1) TaxID=29540 RepID=M0APM6_NATA1|nr:hypothetical protein [Natrialba asiatica]ELZ00475.1 hypothetical protein C481_12534 [Natrialba asiatica DSM 12278]
MSDTTDLRTRVTEILETADAQAGSLVDGDDSPTGSTVTAAAADASDLLASTDPRELLEAIGLGTLPDGTEPETLPEAITHGDPAHVEDLERLLRLARLDERSDAETLDDAVGELQAAIHADGDTDGDGDRSEDTSESDATAAAADDADAADDTDTDTDSDALEFIEDELGSAVGERLASFTEDIEGLQERLAAAGVDVGVGDDDGEDGGDESDGDGTGGDDTDTDDGLLDPDLSTDLGSGSGDERTSRGVARYSTVAPPPGDRADMKTPTRFSTMPKQD